MKLCYITSLFHGDNSIIHYISASYESCRTSIDEPIEVTHLLNTEVAEISNYERATFQLLLIDAILQTFKIQKNTANLPHAHDDLLHAPSELIQVIEKL